MNRTLSVTYDDTLLKAVGLTKEQFEEEMRITLAIRIYRTGAVSTGWAADFAGVPKTLFLDKLAEQGVEQFGITPDELRQDVTVAQRHM